MFFGYIFMGRKVRIRFYVYIIAAKIWYFVSRVIGLKLRLFRIAKYAQFESVHLQYKRY